MSAKSRPSRVGDERSIYRSEVFEYQKKRFLGKSIHIKPMSFLWMVLALGALMAVLTGFARLTYQPEIEASATFADGRFQFEADARVVHRYHLKPGDSIDLWPPDRAERMALVIQTIDQSPASERCLIAAHAKQASITLMSEPQTVRLVLPPQTVLSGFRRN